jgi:molybdenum cofactor cytidylyltransferase
VQAIVFDKLAGALGLDAGELVSIVGAGGKTTAVQQLAGELSAGGKRVVATTSTAMFLSQLSAIGPVHMATGEGTSELVAHLEDVLATGRAAAVAESLGDAGKVAGLSAARLSELWSAGLADFLIVEADGSRGLPFKAFAPHEPQVPAAATTVVVMAGLDALGVTISEGQVHRAHLLASLLDIPLGSVVTARVLADGLSAQIAQLRGTTRARIVAMLNKADGVSGQASGMAVAELLERAASGPRRLPDGPHEAAGADGRADSVVVASLREKRFTRLAMEP